MIEIEIALSGVAPLLMKSEQTADPLNEYARRMSEITKKGAKMTEADHAARDRIQWEASLYWTDELGPYLPAENIQASIKEGAKLTKRGKEIDRALLIVDPAMLIYDGPRSLDDLYDGGFRDRRTVKMNGRTRVPCTRARFNAWKTASSGYLDTERLNLRDLQTILDAAGRFCGIGDYRPKFGRYEGSVKAA